MNLLAKAIGITFMAFLSAAAQAHGSGGAGEEVVTSLAQTALPPQQYRTATALRVDFAPGATSMPHRHPGHVFVVVLSGEVESALDGQAPRRFKAGDAWYESPMQLHRITRNASASEPASLVAWLLSDGEEALVQPVKSKP
ncbi:Cupin domain protein [compost metagenome]|uniref:Cupin domain protein n=1 Tax=Pseudomonas jinjuensis TaxID=198616 RepID=A0A1H0DM77_9PSED|nr:cupin domain-containing protein [Pseudomonas jinjuensis]SDN71254.1 Cupin domain protein [Pseudomonas jinjuensis]